MATDAGTPVPQSEWTAETNDRADWAYGHEARLLPGDLVKTWSFNTAGGGASGISVQRGQISVASYTRMRWSN